MLLSTPIRRTHPPRPLPSHHPPKPTTTTTQIRRISTEFTFKADAAFLADNIRVSPGTEPLGALGDLGWCVELRCGRACVVL